MLARVVKDCLRRRVPIPPPFDNPPSIGPEFNLFVWAFGELSRERDPARLEGKTIVVPRISYRAIRDWAEHLGYSRDFDLMQELYAYIRALDTVWVEVETKRIKHKAK